MKTYKQITEKPCLVIEQDEHMESPRQWDNLGYFITIDSRYNSPDRNEELERIIKDTGEVAGSVQHHMELIKKEYSEKIIAIYPVVKYEHSSVFYSLGTQHGFDYSNNGFYIITDKTAKILNTPKDRFEKVIKGELETYTKWVNGEVYSFILFNEDGDVKDSCCGFYDIEDIREHLPEEYKDEDLTKYLK